MPNTTPIGQWPYVEGTDLATQYPITSQALADLLEERYPKESNAFVPAVGWGLDVGPSEPRITRDHKTYTMSGLIRRTGTSTTITATPIPIVTLPSGFWPTLGPIWTPAHSNAYTGPLQASIDPASGNLNIRTFSGSFAFNQNWYVSILCSFLGA